MSERRAEATPGLSRRALGCAALFGITGPLLVACGSDDPEPGSGSPTGSADSGTPSDTGSATGSNGVLIAAADVPVGGGVVIPAESIVVTQPTKGEFKGFSSVCTHQGSQLSAVSDGKISCPLHGSQFSAVDGSNVTGPNGTAAGSVADLPEVAVKVQGGQVVRA